MKDYLTPLHSLHLNYQKQQSSSVLSYGRTYVQHLAIFAMAMGNINFVIFAAGLGHTNISE